MANYKLFDLLDHTQAVMIDGTLTYEFEREQSPVPGEGIDYSFGLVDPKNDSVIAELCRFSDQIVTEVDGLFTAIDNAGTKHDMACVMVTQYIPPECTPCQTE